MIHTKHPLWKLAGMALLSVVASALPSRAATLWVSTTGSSLPASPTQAQKDAAYAAMQSESSPYRYASVLSVAKTNDVITFEPGTYNRSNLGNTAGYVIMLINKSNLTLKAKYRATATTTNRTVIQATTAEAAGSGFYHVMFMVNQQNILIDGFEITGAAINNSTNRGALGGISIEASDHVTCQYNIVHDCGGGISSVATRGTNNVVLDASDYITIDHNEVYNNCNYSTVNGSGISLLHCKNYNTSDSGFHNKITNNFVHDNKIVDNGGGSGQTHTDGNGIIIDTNSGNNPYSGYTPSYPATGYTDMAGNAIPKCLVENNVAYRNGGRGIHVFKSANVTVRSNSTCDNSQDTTFNPSEIDGAYSKNCLFTNNMAFGNPGRTSLNVLECYTGSGYASATTNNWRSNTAYNGTATDKAALDSTNESGTLIRNPNYTHYPDNLAPYAATPSGGIDNGSNTSGDYSSTDILGVSRPKNSIVDRGAYEYNSGSAAAAKVPSGGSS